MLNHLEFTLPGVFPSWNNYIDLAGRQRFRQRQFEAGWKDWSEWLTWEAIPQALLDRLPLQEPVKLTVEVWRDSYRRHDIHNLYIKPTLDAFTEVGIWEDDNELINPQITIIYRGVDKENPRLKFTFDTLKVRPIK